MTQLEYISNLEKVSMTDEWWEISYPDHFWNKCRFGTILKYLKFLPSKEERLFEIGCGNGLLKSQFENIGYTVDGCDLNLQALEMIDNSKGRVMVYNIYDKNPDLIGKYGAIILGDVIEHIEDDLEFLKTATLYLKDNGVVIINIPANKFLFSKYDKTVGHYRRYNITEIKNLLEKANIEIKILRYWGFLFIPLILSRKIVLSLTKKDIVKKGYTPTNSFLNLLYNLIYKLEVFLSIKINGTSILVIGNLKK